MKKRFATSLVAAALLGLAGTGTAQAAEASAGTPAQVAATTAPATGSALTDLSSLPALILGEVVPVGRLILDWD
ncbi:hypothetical protein [Streptomyces ureilyticus]|jgi:hypothetical protein|uniref:Uncharacterized protein n=1 Tax=Streptomyces ureilyticus TaxID=1775131 RepID=A0ABX0DYL0_9ACTN|nr:hypothetical protein [Streptomyces ureilyticus]NGO44206.1 hypothetical protein [Streptomyces ureilyticus]